MKKAKLIVLGLAAVVLCAALFVACGPEFWCVGGRTSGGAGNCFYNYSRNTIGQCTDTCIYSQGSYIGGVYYYTASKSCNCGV